MNCYIEKLIKLLRLNGVELDDIKFYFTAVVVAVGVSYLLILLFRTIKITQYSKLEKEHNKKLDQASLDLMNFVKDRFGKEDANNLRVGQLWVGMHKSLISYCVLNYRAYQLTEEPDKKHIDVTGGNTTEIWKY